jgi:hypothetical protein
VARVVLIKGAPGSGKSTVAHRLAQARPLDLALDVDVIEHSFGRWDADMAAAGHHARRPALAVVDAQLGAGPDVYLGQFLGRTERIGQPGRHCRVRAPHRRRHPLKTTTSRWVRG